MCCTHKEYMQIALCTGPIAIAHQFFWEGPTRFQDTMTYEQYIRIGARMNPTQQKTAYIAAMLKNSVERRYFNRFCWCIRVREDGFVYRHAIDFLR